MGFAAAIRRKYIKNNAEHSKDDRGGINEVSGRKDLIGNQHQPERAMKRVPRVTQTIWDFGNAINCLNSKLFVKSHRFIMMVIIVTNLLKSRLFAIYPIDNV